MREVPDVEVPDVEDYIVSHGFKHQYQLLVTSFPTVSNINISYLFNIVIDCD